MLMLKNLTKAYGNRFILKHISYHFPASHRIALVGANGAGKTTLLNIICQKDEADTGEVVRPKGLVVGYLPQQPNPHPQATILAECLDGAVQLKDITSQRDHALEEMTREYTDALFFKFEELEQQFQHLGGYQLEGVACRLLTGLGLEESQWEDNPRLLSGGWRMRLELARVLINQPQFLVLDEPTNHLDLPSLIWLEKELTNYKGTLLFVSHDQDLLNRLPTLTLHLHQGQLTPYVGNFEAFMTQKELKQLQSQQLSKNLQNRYDHIERFVDRFRAKPSKAAQVRSRLKMLSRLKDLQETIPEESEVDEMTLRLKIGATSGRQVLLIKDGEIGYDWPLAKKMNLSIQRGHRIAVVGANGIGKSTLLKSMVGEIPWRGGEVRPGHNVVMGYYSQDQGDALDLGKTALENMLQAAPDVTMQEARGLLGAFLLKGDDVFKRTSVLSGGEKSRLALCCLLGQRPNFLLLDEPTNHLDMASAAVLADALAEYEGTVIFVSHDRAFISQVSTHIFVMTRHGGASFLKENDGHFDFNSLS